MARTHKSVRLYEAKLTAIRYRIRVLQAAELFAREESQLHQLSHEERGNLILACAAQYEVTATDLATALVIL